MSTTPTFHYEVSSKVETLHLDGTVKYVLHGKLALNQPLDQGQMFGLEMPDDLWQMLGLGDVLKFEFTGVCDPDELEALYPQREEEETDTLGQQEVGSGDDD